MRSRLSRAAAEAAERHLGKRLLGRVYRDEHVPEALARQASVAGYAPSSKAAQDITAIAVKIAAAISSRTEMANEPEKRPPAEISGDADASVANVVTK